jgi:hypothetical protein
VEDGMARRRIIAHFMHEPERDAALALCQNTEVQGHLVVGDIEEDEIPRLREAGVFVQLAEPEAEAPPSLLPPPTVLGARPTEDRQPGLAVARPQVHVHHLAASQVAGEQRRLEHRRLADLVGAGDEEQRLARRPAVGGEAAQQLPAFPGAVDVLAHRLVGVPVGGCLTRSALTASDTGSTRSGRARSCSDGMAQLRSSRSPLRAS